MLKKLIFLFVLPVCIGISLSSCNKSDKDTVYVEPYVVKGISDLQWKKNAFGQGGAMMSITMEYLNSAQEYLTLSLEGVPQGVGYTITPSSGYAPFSATIYLTDTAAAPGTYNLVLKSKGATTGEKAFNIKLTILGAPSIFEGITGQYLSSYSSCFGSSSNVIHTITRKSPTSDTIVINNFMNTGTNLNAIVTAPMGNLVVYQQVLPYSGFNWEVTGSGYLNFNSSTSIVTSINLSLNLKDPNTSSTFSCSVYINR
jgi:hypothetical protein